MNFNLIANYWDKQAAIWAEEKQEAWTLPETQQWKNYFRTLKSSLGGLKALEVGTASGYFANILSLEGYAVTAIDLSPEMISKARKVSSDLDIEIDYRVMNAQQLEFEENSFDFIFTRLMTWTLPDVEQFYKSSFGVLKKGGLLINFDGDMGQVVFSQEGHERYPKDIMEEANRIKKNLDISKHQRPNRDVELLQKVGFSTVEIDMQMQNKILGLHNQESSIFEIRAIK